MHASRERPQRQQRQRLQRGGVRTHHPADNGDEHELDRGKHSQPMQGLHPYETDTRLATCGGAPPGHDADDADKRRQNYPVKGDRRSRQAAVSNAEQRQSQYENIGPLSGDDRAKVIFCWARCADRRLLRHGSFSVAQPATPTEHIGAVRPGRIEDYQNFLFAASVEIERHLGDCHNCPRHDWRIAFPRAAVCTSIASRLGSSQGDAQ